MWEYIILTNRSLITLVELLNERGKENWEAVNFETYLADDGFCEYYNVLMKREKQ